VIRAIAVTGALVGASSAGVRAQPDETTQVAKQPEAGGGHDTAALQNAVQNPVSNLISVPLQDNVDYDIGPFDRARNTLNIQPVIPVGLSERWNLIVRTIVPIVYQPDVAQSTGGTSGLGDINPTFFLSPAHPGTLMWGLGPTFLLPTATQRPVGAGQWCAGPAVVLVQPKPWTIGVLAQNLWSVAGEDDRADVNQLLPYRELGGRQRQRVGRPVRRRRRQDLHARQAGDERPGLGVLERGHPGLRALRRLAAPGAARVPVSEGVSS
jgi:hypothetical protein